MGWKIEFAKSVENDLKRIDPRDARRILRFLRERIVPLDDPRSIGGPLHGPELGAFWKYRVGHYRIIAAIEDEDLAVEAFEDTCRFEQGLERVLAVEGGAAFDVSVQIQVGEQGAQCQRAKTRRARACHLQIDTTERTER